MDDRRLTFIVVPHGDLETRSFEIAYWKLKLALGVFAGLLVVFVVMVSSWWYMAAQVARVPGLEREVQRLESERAQVAELARTLEEVEAQYERVRQMLGADAVPDGRDSWLPPLREETDALQPDGDASRPDTWPLTQAGWITREHARGRAPHPGLDIAVPQDSYIRAAASGVVRETGTDDVYGRYVLIEHDGGYQTMYGHASRVFVADGDTVERREVIALSGSTGRSTAPHLHFEIRKDGEAVDPLTLIRREDHDLDP